MIESVTLPSIHTNGQYGKANESLENNNNNNNGYRVKFPFQIQPVDPILNQNLIRDFTGMQYTDGVCGFCFHINK